MDGLYPELLRVNTHDDIRRWWEVMDRTTGAVVPVQTWHYDCAAGDVVIENAEPFHDYSVSFLAYIIWDPVHMYNAVINGWKDVEHQITFDVRQPKTHAYTLRRLRRYLEAVSYTHLAERPGLRHQNAGRRFWGQHRERAESVPAQQRPFRRRDLRLQHLAQAGRRRRRHRQDPDRHQLKPARLHLRSHTAPVPASTQQKEPRGQSAPGLFLSLSFDDEKRAQRHKARARCPSSR